MSSSYYYQPLSGHEKDNRWSDETREKVVKNYNLLDLSI